MERYENGKIYKLVNNVDKEIYIGSTCVSLSKRYWKHRDLAPSKPDRKVYKHLNTIGWKNVEIILIESYPCANKMELDKRARHWIDQLNPSLNFAYPETTEEEKKEKKKQYESQDYFCDMCLTKCKINGKQRHFRSLKHQELQNKRDKQLQDKEQEVEIIE